jgi:hypothetical protein
MVVEYSIIKDFCTTRALSIQYVDLGDSYELSAFDNIFKLECNLPKSDTTNTTDFETNLKPGGNKPIINNVATQSNAPFGSKTIIINGVIKKLYARFTGYQQSLSAGSNTIDYTITYPWVKIIGIEVVNCEALDTADLKVYDTSTGTYSGVPNALLNQFSYTLNLPKDYYLKMAQFDADIYQNMIVKVVYNSVSAKTVGINLLFNEVKS